MKIIFLDIDGVLNYSGSAILDEVCVSNLKRVVEETNAKIVLISTWRYFLDDNALKEVKELNDKPALDSYLQYRNLFYNTFKGKMKILCVIPEVKTKNVNVRLCEIQGYLAEHKSEIENFVIIDDWDVEYSDYFPNNWVNPSWFVKGLTSKMADKCVEILQGKN